MGTAGATASRDGAWADDFDRSTIPLRDTHWVTCAAPPDVLFDRIFRLGGQGG
jgi:hypothetical protein